MIRWKGDVLLGHWHGNMAAFTNRCQLLFINQYIFRSKIFFFFLLNNLTKLTVTLLKIIFKYHYYYLFIFISFRRKAEKSLESTLHFFILLIFTCIPEQKKLGKNYLFVEKRKRSLSLLFCHKLPHSQWQWRETRQAKLLNIILFTKKEKHKQVWGVTKTSDDTMHVCWCWQQCKGLNKPKPRGANCCSSSVESHDGAVGLCTTEQSLSM